MDTELYCPDVFRYHRDDFFFQIQKSSSHELTAHHNHNFLQIWYLIKGSFTHLIDGQTYTHNAGDLLILPPYIWHQLDTRNAEDVEWFILDAGDNFLNSFSDSMTKNTVFNLCCLRPLMYSFDSTNPFLHFSGSSAEKLEAIFQTLLEEYRDFSATSPGNIRARYTRLLTYIADGYTATSSNDDNTLYAKYRAGIQNAFDYIDQNLTRYIKLEDLCKAALLSRTSFTYIFRQLTGKSAIEYINSLRVRMAKRLLLEGRSVTQVCHECGFNDVTHFCRIFKKIAGCTPKQFAKPNKGTS